MKKHWKKILVAATAAAVWLSAYLVTNDYYRKLNNKTITWIDEIGVWVEYGDNKIGKTDANGYSIRADGVNIYDYWEYCDMIDFVPVKGKHRITDKVIVVTVTLHNEDNESTTSGVVFPEMRLHTQSAVFHMDTAVLIAANPALEGYRGISLGPGKTMQFQLPFPIMDEELTSWALAHLEGIELWLNITGYLEQISLRVQ